MPFTGHLFVDNKISFNSYLEHLYYYLFNLWIKFINILKKILDDLLLYYKFTENILYIILLAFGIKNYSFQLIKRRKN